MGKQISWRPEYSAIDILKYYYGDSMYINTAEEISGIPASWPGYNLDIGSSGQKVRQLQEQLNLIGEFYNAIPPVEPDGIYGEQTAEASKKIPRKYLICLRLVLLILQHGTRFPENMLHFQVLRN